MLRKNCVSFATPNTQKMCSPITENVVKEFNRRWQHISTTPHKNKKMLYTVQTDMITLRLPREEQSKFELKELLKVEFSSHKPPFSVIN